MSFYETIKKTLTDTVDAVIDKTTTQAQKSRLRIVMRNETKLTNDAYIELGKYLYDNLREGANVDVELTCQKIDCSKQRMQRAQERYREVLQEELVNREITKTEVRENFQKIKEPIVAKAKDTAEKVTELKDAAKEKAVELKDKMPKVKVGYGEITEASAQNTEYGKETADIPAETANTSNIGEDALHSATQKITEPLSSDLISRASATKEETEKKAPTITFVTAEIDNSEDEITSDVAPQEIYSYSAVCDSSEAEPTDSSVTQEFQRTMAVDIADDADFENYTSTGSFPKATASDKANKLKKIISEQESDNSESADPEE